MRLVPYFIGTVLLLCIPIASQPTLTYTEYEKLLSEQLTLDKMYREQIAQEQALIIDFKEKINDSRERIASIRQQMFAVLGVTPAEVEQISDRLKLCVQELRSIENLSDDQLLANKPHVTSVIETLDTISNYTAIRLPALKKKVDEGQLIVQKITNRVQSVESANNASMSVSADEQEAASLEPIESYTVSRVVGRPETLYSIANKVYGNPNRWPDIYQANRDVLDGTFKRLQSVGKKTVYTDPSDLILPGQILVIPR